MRMSRLGMSKLFPLWALALLCILSGCGYQLATRDEHNKRLYVSVPRIKGDVNDRLANQVAMALTRSGKFLYSPNRADIELGIDIIQDDTEHIGYVYDKPPDGGANINRLMPNEGRRITIARVSIFDAATGRRLYGPVEVFSEAGYQFVNFDNIESVQFVNPEGVTQDVLTFSQGQLGSEDDAKIAARTSTYRRLAQKIIDGLYQFDTFDKKAKRA